MDDLSGLNWSTPANNTSNKKPPMNPSSAFSYPSLRPTPSPQPSGRNTPLSSQGSGAAGFKQPAAAPKAAQDSFSGLVNFGAAKSTANLSLREQQERLEAERRKKEEEKRKQAQTNYGDGRFFDTLGSRSTTPSSQPAFGALNNGKAPADSEDDLFAAFKSTTLVDNASHFPPPIQRGQTPLSRSSTPANAPGLNLGSPSAWEQPTSSKNTFDDDDDPFGLSELKPKSQPAPTAAADDDDLLGDLGKPIEEVRREQEAKARAKAKAKAPEPEPGKPIEDSESESPDEDGPVRKTGNDPFDKAVAQIVDYGFTPEDARRALTESGAGLNVQAAVNFLLDDAHKKSKEKARQKQSQAGRLREEDDRASSSGRSRNASPAWAQDEGPSRRDNRSPGQGEVDFTKQATALGNSFMKSANSLWKTGQKKMQKAVADFQQQDAGDPSQPKWMRSAQQDMHAGQPDRKRTEMGTDEAMMLESGGRPPRRDAASSGSSRNQSPAVRPSAGSRTASASGPKWQQASQASLMDPRSRISKQEVEEQSAQAYISPARRKKATPQPQPEARPPPEPETDLLFESNQPSRAQAPPTKRSAPAVAKVQNNPPPPKPRPAQPARQIPPLSDSALQTSTKHRLEGTAHFKRGDFASAHASYGSSLSALPQSHPLAILLLCNHALTALKTGEPRQAVEDADTALKLIGPGKGEGETVSLGGPENETRDMKDLYGKALTRKAEALEQMEKWSDASVVWQTCVESGVGGPTATAGRQRCQKALAPKPKPKAAPPRPKPKPAAVSNKSSEAVVRLREANAAAAQADEEKFALVDKVDARIAAWRDGKRDNLRALLGSLDQVLWEGSGWKKVGLHELVVANKVKIIYMKAIAKCHPDKIAQDASTEVRMIAGTVFATLNESWDKFKAENGL
ncbi:uncharacterized protein PgNI_06831 [Pyricularia grisea]|uniref:UBA domain-containing protein n=1 Tax=Pyricularia grisea TaxID=148305 RepID=A0A6P8B2E4_PYRGI|nr:uncharacterized protein PgNI_06831 [Pyricularia grisea]TLD09075.1 hypothetical protein PgNI_06831 [Pyricularia grisea]